MKIITKKRVFNKIFGTVLKPRLSVFRSNKHIYCQLIDDDNGVTICSSSTIYIGLKKDGVSTSTKKASFAVGKDIGLQAIKKKISKIVFDKGKNIYHGRVKSLAEGIRDIGLKF